jgi:carnitine O-acetyltransferase
MFENWGASSIKKRFQCAPDAFFQAVLQLAGARFFGRAVLTYESGSTRGFAHGRTETIRGATMEAQAAGEAMRRFQESCAASDEEVAEAAKALLQAVRVSCAAHKQVTARAMRGQGVDRHLLALRVLDQLHVDRPGSSPEEQLSALWRSPAWMLEYELSTSQTPLVQEFRAALPDTTCLALGGGFGPSCAGGVGVSYFLLDKFLYFHCSSNRTADSMAVCGAPAIRTCDISAPEGSPMAHAKAFSDAVTAVLLDLEHACRLARPGVWPGKRLSKL